MVTLSEDTLEFRFPDVHESACCQIDFQRTLRIPDDDKDYPLPPGLGQFPLAHMDDYKDRVPSEWSKRGGVFFPMYQAEAMWIRFDGGYYPCAVKIATGKINAVSGKNWENDLSSDPQDYVVTPEQLWIDGFCVSKGLIRQFVAMPLGHGITAEEQLTGKAEHGGLQLCVYPMKRDFYEKWQSELRAIPDSGIRFSLRSSSVCESSMGLAPGGLMRQNIKEDTHGIEAWDMNAMSRCFVHLVNSEQYLTLTGSLPPQEPITAVQYNDAGLPWFEVYDSDQKALNGSKTLSGLDSVAQKMKKMFGGYVPKSPEMKPKKVVILDDKGKVKDGEW